MMDFSHPRSALTALLASMVWVTAAQAQAQRLPVMPLRAGMHNIKAEMAVTDEQRQIGLMHRASMGNNEGMLFVFERPGVQCFWMKNTLIPLQTAFLTDDGTVVNLAEMKPKSLDNHCSAGPVRFVLEMNTGWFSKRGIKPGARLQGEPFGTPR
ncbi:MAG: uncharacterized protein QG554_1398 [Pseudomonadota bacterium]|nr:uncharacterized protein [Pseudomonadota bacterium]